MSAPTKPELIEEYAHTIKATMADIFDVAIGNACKHELIYALQCISTRLFTMCSEGQLDRIEEEL